MKFDYRFIDTFLISVQRREKEKSESRESEKSMAIENIQAEEHIGEKQMRQE